MPEIEVKKKKLKEIVLLDGLKQLSATELESLNTFSGNIKLLPSSKNNDWFCDENSDISEYIYEDEIITVGRARYANIKYYNGKFIASQNHLIRSLNKERINTKYLYYILMSNSNIFYTIEGSYPLFNKDVFENFEVYLPSIKRQKEIVEKLDAFSCLISDNKVGLVKELEKRKQQYEYYRDMILSFK